MKIRKPRRETITIRSGGFTMKVEVESSYEIYAAIDRAQARVAARTGGLLRKIGRRNIKKVPTKAKTKRGQVAQAKRIAASKKPYNRTGALKNFILYAADKRKGSVVVGPKLLRKRIKEQPKTLEYGGVTLVRNWKGDLVRAKIRERSFMRVALAEAKGSLAKIWKSQIR